MKRPRLVLSAVLALAASMAAGQGLAEYSLSPRNFITYRSRAFLVAPPVLVCGPKVVGASWSPDGSFMLIQQRTAPTNVRDVESAFRATVQEHSETQLKIFSLATGNAADLMRLDSEKEEVSSLQWIPQTDHAFMVVAVKGDTPAAELYNVSAADGTVDPIRPWKAGEEPFALDVYPSPTQPYVFVRASFGKPEPPRLDLGREEPHYRRELFLLNAQGTFVPVKSPEGVPLWSSDGAAAYILERTHNDKGPGAQWYKVALANGALSDTTRPRDFYQGGARPAGLISAREVPTPSTNGNLTREVRNVWLETLDPDSQNRLLLAGDASLAGVSSTLEAASYVSQDSLFVRPILEVPKDRYDAAVAYEKRRQQIAKAQQTGLALIMLAADNDDIFPADRNRIKDLLGPYLAPGFNMDDFVYTFQGGDAKDLKNPAGTQLGYIDTGDGLAVVYADGHTEWKPKPGKK